MHDADLERARQLVDPDAAAGLALLPGSEGPAVKGEAGQGGLLGLLGQSIDQHARVSTALASLPPLDRHKARAEFVDTARRAHVDAIRAR